MVTCITFNISSIVVVQFMQHKQKFYTFDIQFCMIGYLYRITGNFGEFTLMSVWQGKFGKWIDSAMQVSRPDVRVNT